jgi:serine/threonine protein kinase
MSGELNTVGQTQQGRPAREADSPATRLSLGEWCVSQGLATREEVEACLAEQRRRSSRGSPPVRMGELLVERGVLTRSQVSKALAVQNEEIRQCLHCAIRVNVPVEGSGASFRCPRCERALVPSPDGGPLDAVFEPALVIDRTPLPEDVQLAMSDPARRFGKYVLLQEAGRGGVGRVYRAWDTYLGQIVALKRLLGDAAGGAPGLDTAHAQSLIQEARSAIRLRHPGIVSVFDVGRVEREYYVSMEYIEGETLHDRITAAHRRGRTSSLYEDLPGSLRILAEVARAVHYAHSRTAPIIHCDLKPGNILIDGEGHAHVVDFGLARTLHQEPQAPGEISGTPAYMAPEQASGRTDLIDARTDVYAMGAILYELLGGRPPFVGMTLEVLTQIIDDPPEPPFASRRRLKPDGGGDLPAKAGEALEELCLRCLRKDRAQRPLDLEEVAASLERLSVGPAPTGSPETPLPAAQHPSTTAPGLPPRRGLRRVGWVAAALLLLGAGVESWFLVERLHQTALERRVAAEIGRFRPEKALAEVPSGEGTEPEDRLAVLVEEARRVSALKNRLLADLGRIPDALEADPLQLAALIERANPHPTPEERFALGLFLLRAERPAEARRHLELLRDTPLGPQAGRYLHGLNR